MPKHPARHYHQEFDANHWRSVFDSRDLTIEDRDNAGNGIVGPRDLWVLEQLRSEIIDSKCSAPGVPADVFIFARGEAPRPAATKIGGVPYRPADLAWPRHAPAHFDEFCDTSIVRKTDTSGGMKDIRLDWESKLDVDGRQEFVKVLYESVQDYIEEEAPSLRFLGQFNFADSTDLVGTLPGDVLLLFGSFGYPYIEYYEWQPLGLTDLVTAEQMPKRYSNDEWDYLPVNRVCCYGQIYRLNDYPDGPQFDERFATLYTPKAHRIGGLPYLIQAEVDLPGRVICVFDGVSPTRNSPWPWLDFSQPLPYDRDIEDDNDTFIDCSSSIYISIDSKGDLHWASQCT